MKKTLEDGGSHVVDLSPSRMRVDATTQIAKKDSENQDEGSEHEEDDPVLSRDAHHGKTGTVEAPEDLKKTVSKSFKSD